jgi:tetratricopeptide (TPR) repeat protein
MVQAAKKRHMSVPTGGRSWYKVVYLKCHGAFMMMMTLKGVFPRLFAATLTLCLYLTVGISICAADIPGYPESVEGYDSREIYLLPRYCVYTLTFRRKLPRADTASEVERLTKELGPTFGHLHHYCWGLMKTNRANLLARTEQDRLYYLRDSLGEFDYVIDRSPLDFRLLPEILTKKGDTLIRLDRAGEGMLEFQRAIKIKPDYWQAYAAMSDHYKETGQIAKAREWLEKGLSAAPNAKTLKERLAELDAAQSKRKKDPRAHVGR